jgi:hypothetical protein
MADDEENRCPTCHHLEHPQFRLDTGGCSLVMSSVTERIATAEHDRELQRQGVAPEVSGPYAHRDLCGCGCQERPKPGAE